MFNISIEIDVNSSNIKNIPILLQNLLCGKIKLGAVLDNENYLVWHHEKK